MTHTHTEITPDGHDRYRVRYAGHIVGWVRRWQTASGGVTWDAHPIGASHYCTRLACDSRDSAAAYLVEFAKG